MSEIFSIYPEDRKEWRVAASPQQPKEVQLCEGAIEIRDSAPVDADWEGEWKPLTRKRIESGAELRGAGSVLVENVEAGK